MKRNHFSATLLYVLLIGLLAIIVIGFVAVEIYVWVTYANVPISELPAWVLFFMFGGGD